MTFLIAGAAAAVLTAVAVLALRRRVVVISVTGQSMQPTLQAGDRLVVRRARVDALRRGDIVVIRLQEPCRSDHRAGLRSSQLVVKRVAAVSGDPAPAFLPHWARGDGSLAPGTLVVLGDNPEVSRDSRHFGTVSAEALLGVAVRRLGGGTLPRI